MVCIPHEHVRQHDKTHAMHAGKSITVLIPNPIRRRAVRGEASIRLLYPESKSGL